MHWLEWAGNDDHFEDVAIASRCTRQDITDDFIFLNKDTLFQIRKGRYRRMLVKNYVYRETYIAII